MRCSHTSQALRMRWSVKKATYLIQRKILLGVLRQLRSDAGLTQAQLAARLHRDRTLVSRYESGERRLDILERVRCVARLKRRRAVY